MKTTTKLLMLLATSFMLFACGKEEISNPKKDNEITLYGNVIDRASGSPLYNVMIELYAHSEYTGTKDKVLGSTVTGNDGNYEFTVSLSNDNSGDDNSDGVTFYVRASKDKYSTADYTLNLNNADKSNRIKVDFQITSASIFYTGKVKDSNNQPLSDVKIKAKYYSANASESRVRDYGKAIGTTIITDANGSYLFEVPIPNDINYLPQWQYLIYAEKDGYATAEHFVNQNEDDMGRTITLNFTMKSNKEIEAEKQVKIYGKVTDQYGKPIVNAEIQDYIYSSDYKGSSFCYSTTQTDSKGEYEFITPTRYYSSYDYLYHWYDCSANGYKTVTKTLKTSYGDKGKTYNFDFVLYKR